MLGTGLCWMLNRAKRAAQKGPVFITTRGKPAYVLMSIDEYRQVKGKSMTLAEALAAVE